MGLVVTLTANAALDRTLSLGELRTRRRQRVQAEHVQAGGKGVNVSRVLHALDVTVRSVVVLGGDTGRTIERDLEASGLAPVTVAAPGESRTCLEILETRNGGVTQLHGAGVRGSEETTQSILAAVAASLDGAEWLAICGSLPDGCPADTYARLVLSARERGVRVALDASGRALVAGWRAGPDLLRINRDEFAEAIGVSASEELRSPPRDTPGAARLSVVSDGPKTAWAWETGGLTWRITPPRVRARNPIGCGDAMLAGLLASLANHPTEEALRFATAIAAADAESEFAGRPDSQRAQELASAVLIDRA